MDFIRTYQLDIMLIIASIVATALVFTFFVKFHSNDTKRALIAMEICAFIMIVMDRYAYIYRGNETTMGFYMVRISNFLVFFMILAEIGAFTRYVMSVLRDNDVTIEIPKELYILEYLLIIGSILLIISQFTGLYYTFDETNHYQRSMFFPICYGIPVACFILMAAALIKDYDKLNKRVRLTVLTFPLVIMIASMFQLFLYGISINTLSFCAMTVVLFVSAIEDVNVAATEAKQREMNILEEQSENFQELFAQTIEALASAIDAKDPYTRGHSNRVADYSLKLAKLAGKSKEECQEIYYAAVVHDVGKIGIPNAIINKNGKLTDEEYEVIKNHTVVGSQILSRITKRTYLSIGARFHHERYDGRGYPEHLKGEDIPEMARIIAVADAYDAMTSKRSYRDPVPQQKVREEIITGMGTQFDPKYAKLMLELIDSDEDYTMKEKQAIEQLDGRSEMGCGKYREDVTNGFRVTDHWVKIKFNASPVNKARYGATPPTVIMFDSLNQRVCSNEADIKATDYYEYGEIHMDGTFNASNVRKVSIEKTDRKDVLREYQYCVEAVKYKDHALVKLDNGHECYEMIIALPCSSKFVYLALTGEFCVISDITTNFGEETIGPDYIPRIAPKIVYLDLPEGDIPNVEVDNYRTEYSSPVVLDKSSGNMELEFTYVSYPTAGRIWHCPMLVIYASKDGKIKGQDYREYVALRLDGESWSESFRDINRLVVNKLDEFTNWESWKERNSTPQECSIKIRRELEKVIIETENGGISISNTTTLPDSPEKIYFALSGDQVAMSSIKVVY